MSSHDETYYNIRDDCIVQIDYHSPRNIHQKRISTKKRFSSKDCPKIFVKRVVHTSNSMFVQLQKISNLNRKYINCYRKLIIRFKSYNCGIKFSLLKK